MKSLPCPLERGSASVRGERKRPSFMGKAVLAGAMLAAPLGPAAGQDSIGTPGTEADRRCITQPGTMEITGKEVVLLDGKGKRVAIGCLSDGERPLDIRLNLNDSQAVLLFYPIIDMDTEIPVNSVQVRFILDGEPQDKVAFIDPVSLRIKDPGQNGLDLPPGKGLASPILISNRIGEGEHTISFIAAHGVAVIKQPNDIGIMIPSLVEIPGTPDDAPKGADAIAEPPKAPPDAQHEKGPEPYGKSEAIMTLDLNRASYAPSKERNSWEMNGFELRFYPRLARSLSLLAGISGDYKTMRIIDTAHVGILAASLQAGLELEFGGHKIRAGCYGGMRKTDAFVIFDGTRTDAAFIGAEYGGLAAYDYGGILGLAILGGNNPINPATLRLYAESPYTWAGNVKPRLEIGARWLHLLRPLDDGSGAVALDGDDLHLQAMLRVPVCPIGYFTPSVIAGFSLSAGGRHIQAHPEDVYLGATITTSILDRVRLEMGGAYAPSGTYLAILKGSLPR